MKYLNSIAANKGETVFGCYVPIDNMIYIGEEQEETVKLHVLYHELKHAFDVQTADMESEEARCDVFAAMLLKLNPNANCMTHLRLHTSRRKTKNEQSATS